MMIDEVFTDGKFYPEKSLRRRVFTQKSLHRDVFRHRRFSTEKL